MKETEQVLQVADEKKSWVYVLFGPFFVVLSMGFSVYFQRIDLALIALVGFFLSAHFHSKGLTYAIAGLALFSVPMAFFTSTPLLYLAALEASVALSWFITALTCEDKISLFSSLRTTLEHQSSTIVNLEESLSRAQKEAAEQIIHLEDKQAQAQKELEELKEEKSSLLSLNDLLRKASSSQIEEQEKILHEKEEAHREITRLMNEKEELQQELARLLDTNLLKTQNDELFQELNTARSAQMQTQLINETLARVYANEKQKNEQARQQLLSIEGEKDRFCAEVSSLKTELETVNAYVETLKKEVQLEKEAIDRLEALRQENLFLKERVEQAQLEVATIKNELPTDPEVIKKLQETERRYLQLRQQFEEKNGVLHKTRVDLFHTNTALETLQKKIHETSADEPQDRFFAALEEEFATLEEENQALHSLIHSLLNTL